LQGGFHVQAKIILPSNQHELATDHVSWVPFSHTRTHTHTHTHTHTNECSRLYQRSLTVCTSQPTNTQAIAHMHVPV